jgi:putative oxidoreductase
MTTFDIALLIMRIVLGAIFIAHGGQKLFGWFGGHGMKKFTQMMAKNEVPVFLAWMAALSEFGGGLLVLLGLLTPLAAALTISVMLVAIAEVHGKNGFFNTNRGYEFNLSLIAMAGVLILTGAGVISVDWLLGLAEPLNQLPLWAILGVVVVPFGGIILTELARRMTGTSQLTGAEQK